MVKKYMKFLNSVHYTDQDEKIWKLFEKFKQSMTNLDLKKDNMMGMAAYMLCQEAQPNSTNVFIEKVRDMCKVIKVMTRKKFVGQEWFDRLKKMT